MSEKKLFDDFTEQYDNWFKTPIGKLVNQYEAELVMDFLQPERGEFILDAGCGTAVFTQDFLAAAARVVGLDISRPMLKAAKIKTPGYDFNVVQGDMLSLPFRDNIFDKAVSITALEFIQDSQKAVGEMFRVTRQGGSIIIGTLNSLSPWAARRRAKTEKHILQEAFFRSPDEVLALSPVPGLAKTVVHFEKSDDPENARLIERNGQAKKLNTGAFLLVKWIKPGD